MITVSNLALRACTENQIPVTLTTNQSTTVLLLLRLSVENAAGSNSFKDLPIMATSPDANNSATFWLEKKLKAELGYIFPNWANQPQNQTQLIKRYKIAHAELTAADSSLTAVFTPDNSDTYVLRGGFSYYDYPTAGAGVSFPNGTGNLITSRPRNRVIGLHQLEYITIVPANTSNIVLNFECTYTDNTTKNFNKTYTPAAKFCPILIPVGNSQVPEYVEGSKVLKTVIISSNPVVTLNFEDYNTYPNKTEFYYFTQAGSMESLMCLGQRTITHQIESDRLRHYRPVGYNSQTFENRDYREEQQAGGEVFTGYMSKAEQQAALNAVCRLPTMMRYFDKRRNGFVFQPVLITVSEHSLNTGIVPEGLVVNFEFAYQGISDPATFTVAPPTDPAPIMLVSGNNNPIFNGSTVPNLATRTDFGSSDNIIIRTFNITNIGNAPLDLSGDPVVLISGANAVDFSVSALPTTTIPPGGSTIFQITFSSDVIGLKSALVSIANNSGENPYTFAIQATAVAVALPNMVLKGNNIIIANGETVPSAATGTDFGGNAGIPITRTFTIENDGSALLILTGDNLVQVSGINADDFYVSNFPTTPILPNTSVTFTITFNSVILGSKSAIISIPNNSSANPYTFAVAGIAQALPAPIMVLKGNNITIDNGETTTSQATGTDFGQTGSNNVVRTFTIENIGNAALQLTGSPLVQIGGSNAADFSITGLPTTPIAPNSSVTFMVTYNSSVSGVKNAIISIPNNSATNPYTFAISAETVEVLFLRTDGVNDYISPVGLNVNLSGDFEINLVYTPFAPLGGFRSLIGTTGYDSNFGFALYHFGSTYDLWIRSTSFQLLVRAGTVVLGTECKMTVKRVGTLVSLLKDNILLGSTNNSVLYQGDLRIGGAVGVGFSSNAIKKVILTNPVTGLNLDINPSTEYINLSSLTFNEQAANIPINIFGKSTPLSLTTDFSPMP